MFIQLVLFFSVSIDDNTIDQTDPQELVVYSSQDLEEGEDLMAGSVIPLKHDGVMGYTFATMSPNIIERLYFESSGLFYLFIMMWSAFGEHEEIDKVIDSIK